MLLDKQCKKIAYVCARNSHFFAVKFSGSLHAGKNNDDCDLKGISKKHFFQYSVSTFHINFNFWLNAVGPIRHSYREMFR